MLALVGPLLFNYFQLQAGDLLRISGHCEFYKIQTENGTESAGVMYGCWLERIRLSRTRFDC